MNFSLLKKEQFDIFYKMLTENFPASERRTYIKHKEMLDNPLYKVFLYCSGENVLGMIAEWEFDDFLYIEHLAVSKHFQSKGIGSSMLRDFKLKFNQKIIILEVELPNTLQAEKRIEFYKRFNFKINGYEYIQPPMQEGQADLSLIILSSDRKLNRDEFVKCRNTLYKEVYKRLPDSYLQE